MTFHFSWFCKLVDELHNQKHQGRATYARQDDPRDRIVTAWFKQYEDQLNRRGHSGLALLSALFPECRSDRTYNLQDRRLAAIFGRALALGDNRLRLLNEWQQKNGPDFATCVERVMAEAEFDPPRTGHEVTLEEIDIALTKIAANTKASAPHIRAQVNDKTPAELLAPIICRLSSSEAKWLVRMIIKSYLPAEIPEYAALHNFHFMLPRLLRIQNSFEAAIEVISRQDIAKLPARPSKEYETALLPFMFKEIEPRFGVMIQRQALDKARSIKHCVNMANTRIMSIERKYDGEYCQIHVDRSCQNSKVQIFSKSGRDSTNDRLELLGPIKTGLKLGHPDCKIRRRAILEGELVVYSKAKRAILPFYHIRKHVKHGARSIGTEADSPRKAGEQLMIVFFDVLLLDNKVLANEPHSLRRQYLKTLITSIDGTSCIGERALINFASSNAPQKLRQSFAAAIRQRWEGLVLKGADDPYFSWKQGTRGIKLKKDYIMGLGDTIDLCIVGGRNEGRAGLGLNVGHLTWTHFYVACLTNKQEVVRYGELPSFRIIDCVGPGSVNNVAMTALNEEGCFVQQRFALRSKYMTFDNVCSNVPPPTDIFTKPIVVEMTGAGFERPQSANFYVLRFPRGIKIHRDRGIEDTVDFDELQTMAEHTLNEDKYLGSQEDAVWIGKLLAADPRSKYLVEQSQQISPLRTPQSASSMSITPGSLPRSATQPPISPIFVREDSVELTTGRSPDQYPSSCPQTPSKTAAFFAPPAATNSRMTAKRPSITDSESPLYGPPQKRNRGGFISSSSAEKVAQESPLTENNNLTEKGNLRKQIQMQTADQEESCQTLNQKVTYLSATSHSGLVAPPSTEEATKAGLSETTSADSNGGKLLKRNVPALLADGVLRHVLDSNEHERSHARLYIPLYIVPSAPEAAKADDVLRKHNFSDTFITTSRNDFADMIMLNMLTDQHIQKVYIVLFNTERASDAVRDLRRLSRTLHARLESERFDHPALARILIFDYRALDDKEFAVMLQAHREVDYERYQKWCCGELEILNDEQGRTGFRLNHLRKGRS